MTYPKATQDDLDLGLYFFEEALYGALYASGTATINEQDSETLDGGDIAAGQKRLICYFDSEQTVAVAELQTQVSQMARLAKIELEMELSTFDDQSWRDNWKAWFKPAQVSPRIAIRTPWSEFEAPEGCKVIVIEPGMAFGTGLHETTQLCIRAIDKHCSAHKTVSMLDVGCGSGVLAIAARFCGASEVRGIDNDPICVEVSLENAELNHCEASFDGTDIWDVEERYDLVVANIISSVLKALKEDIKAVVKPGGSLILSGILAIECDDVKDAFLEGAELEWIGQETLGEWVSLSFSKPE